MTTIAVTVALCSTMAVAQPVAAVVDPSIGTLDGLPGTTPGSLAGVPITDLQFGDPTDNIALVEPPTVDNTGGASLSHVLPVPPGRGGIAPSLELSYDSGGGSGWVGTGWDLDVGAITVDTTFGAPIFSSDKESETYAIDGERLAPDAIRTVADMVTRASRPSGSLFTRVVEGSHERIRRHGSTPATYYWEVADKAGTTRWYGGSPSGQSTTQVLAASQADGQVRGVFHWPLTLVVDVNGNTIEYGYETTTDAIAQGGSATGFYLDWIEYTGFVDAALDAPAYRVEFARDDDVSPAPTARRDVEVDARNGAVLATTDLLRRVEVKHRNTTTTPHSWTLARGYGLTYATDTAYGKALLTSVDQYGTGGPTAVHASHSFDYHDEVSTVAADGTPCLRRLRSRAAVGRGGRGHAPQPGREVRDRHRGTRRW